MKKLHSRSIYTPFIRKLKYQLRQENWSKVSLRKELQGSSINANNAYYSQITTPEGLHILLSNNH